MDENILSLKTIIFKKKWAVAGGIFFSDIDPSSVFGAKALSERITTGRIGISSPLNQQTGLQMDVLPMQYSTCRSP